MFVNVLMRAHPSKHAFLRVLVGDSYFSVVVPDPEGEDLSLHVPVRRALTALFRKALEVCRSALSAHHLDAHADSTAQTNGAAAATASILLSPRLRPLRRSVHLRLLYQRCHKYSITRVFNCHIYKLKRIYILSSLYSSLLYSIVCLMQLKLLAERRKLERERRPNRQRASPPRPFRRRWPS